MNKRNPLAKPDETLTKRQNFGKDLWSSGGTSFRLPSHSRVYDGQSGYRSGDPGFGSMETVW